MSRLAGEQMEEASERELMDELEAGELAVEYDDKDPQEVLGWAIARFGRGLAIFSSFQAEGCALIDMAWRIDPAIRVFTIDTGRMPQETYDVIDAIRAKYGVKTETYSPDGGLIEQMTTRNGQNLFYESVNMRLLCCQVRKVLPRRRALVNYDAWVTGLRRDQWATRSNIRKIEIDHDHGGARVSGPQDLPGVVEAVEHVALVEELGLRPVQVFGLGLRIERAPAKREDAAAAAALDREHDAVAEAVVGRAAILRRDQQSGIDERRRLRALGDQVVL